MWCIWLLGIRSESQEKYTVKVIKLKRKNSENSTTKNRNSCVGVTQTRSLCSISFIKLQI